MASNNTEKEMKYVNININANAVQDETENLFLKFLSKRYTGCVN